VAVGYVMETMSLRALPTPIQLDASISSLGFTLTETFLHDCSQNYTAGQSDCVVKAAITCKIKQTSKIFHKCLLLFSM